MVRCAHCADKCVILIREGVTTDGKLAYIERPCPLCRVPIATSPHDLFNSMVRRKPLDVWYNGTNIVGIVNKVEVEDGSGRNFLVTFMNGQTKFVSFKS